MNQMGCVILAGGLGTRLGLKGPKGCVKVGEKETLFEILLSKMKGPVAVMTSPLNRVETEQFLKEHHFFGIEDLVLFDQDLKEGYPDGNGGVFERLWETGIWKEWKKKGITAIGVLPIDNPLGSVEDLFPLHEELVIRCILSRDPSEKIGRVLVEEGRVSVREYTEMATVTGLGFTGQFGCTMEFVERVSQLPPLWHQIYKEGKVRFERFIFDVFPHAKTHRLVVSPRDKYFAPVKDQISLNEVRRRWKG